MRGRRAVVAAVAAWVLVVTVGSTLVWVVISRAGAGVVAGEDVAGASTAPRPAPATPSGPAQTPRVQTPPQTPLPPVARRGTWQGSAGVVVVECRRGAVRLVGAYPNSGWSMRVEERGPGRVAIGFTGGEDRGETSLGAQCGQGIPAYTVTAGGSGDRSDDG